MIYLLAAIGWLLSAIGWACVEGQSETITMLLLERERLYKQINAFLSKINGADVRKDRDFADAIREHDSRKGRLGVAAKQAQAWDRAHGVGLGAP